MKISVTSPVVINVPSRVLLAAKTKSSFVSFTEIYFETPISSLHNTVITAFLDSDPIV